jgi:uncharacterized protein (DUF4415 family)
MARKERIVSYTDKELRAMRARGQSKTDWARVRATTEQEIERQIAADPDERDLVFDWSKATAFLPLPKSVVNMRMDHDVLAFFKKSGRGYQTRINAVLRSYVEAQRRKDDKKRTRRAAAE